MLLLLNYFSLIFVLTIVIPQEVLFFKIDILKKTDHFLMFHIS